MEAGTFDKVKEEARIVATFWQPVIAGHCRA